MPETTECPDGYHDPGSGRLSHQALELALARHEERLEQVAVSLGELAVQSKTINKKIVGLTTELDLVRTDFITRYEMLLQAIASEREERRSADDGLHKVVEDLAITVAGYVEEAARYREKRVMVEISRDQALGIRTPVSVENGGRLPSLQAVARTMTQPRWWATLAAVAGGLILQAIVEWLATIR